MTLIDLPEDILSIIFLFLSPKDFLALCCSSKVLYSNYHKDSQYWRTETSTTFRTPISPLLKADGARWYSLFRRLKTQTRLFTWGQGLKGNLGHGIGARQGLPNRRIRGPGRPNFVQPPRLVYQRTTSTWPTEAHVPDEVGVIADLQCGGWSTVILSSAGRLYITGAINHANFVNTGGQTDRFERLEYLTQSTSAISQFSAGRTHILALTDDGDIVTWDRINTKGLKIHSRHHGKLGKPRRVVAGWGEGSAYIPERGIVYWTPPKNDQEDEMLDAREVNEKVIPNTSRSSGQDGTILEVSAYVVLEGLIVWITSDSKVWACDIAHENPEDSEPTGLAVELPGYFDGTDELRDIQGSFRRFVVFTASGKVLAGDGDYVRRCFEAARLAATHNIDDVDSSDPASWPGLNNLLSTRPRDVPALQNTGVIAVAFGDWHYQALHSDGKISSHGHEPESCGAMGLGEAYSGAMLRGMYTGPQGMRQDSKLRPVADLRGRQVWFEPEKRDWLGHLQETATKAFAENREERYWHQILNNPVKQAMFSEWIEQEGRHWEDGPTTLNTALPTAVDQLTLQHNDDFHLDSYFALAIGAAGWHSGALVLVDDEKAERTRQKWMSQRKTETQKSLGGESQGGRSPDLPMPGQYRDEPSTEADEGPKAVWVVEEFPRIKFPDGSEIPLPASNNGEQTLGSAFRPWRDGMPTLEQLGLGLE